MDVNSAKYYYGKKSWDVDAWVEIIYVEYEQLIQKYLFDAVFKRFNKSPINLLDIGCGTGIFPSYLDKTLSENVQLNCDLLDISKSSLDQARNVFDGLEHFSPQDAYQIAIEDIPNALNTNQKKYDVIWAIHSFTTVDVSRMEKVIEYLLGMLAPGGMMMIYQLSPQSSYQKIHAQYLSEHPNGRQHSPYMDDADTQKILNALEIEFQVHEFFFHHQIEGDHRDLLEKYLKKCILDDSVDVLSFYETLLKDFYRADVHRYMIPQHVNLIIIEK